MVDDPVPHLLAIASEVMALDDYVVLERPAGAVRFRGRLMAEPSHSYEALAERARRFGYLPMLQRDDGRDSITFLPHTPVAYRTRPRLALLLLVLTILSTLFVGASMTEPDLPSMIRHPLSGLPFSLALMLTLGVHEMGHFLMARHYGVQVTLPYFIPMPFGPFGTMGAFISMKSVPVNKRQLLHIGLAGPLAGLAVGLIVCLYGLSISPLSVMQPGTVYYREGNSILYLLLKYAIFGRWLPSGSLDVNLSPVGFAGWAGLLVTGLNLIPAAQLDGGHIAYALFGRRARIVTFAIAGALLLLGVWWQGWILWAAIILLLGWRPQVVLDEITGLTRRDKLVAALGLILFILLFVPLPLVIVGS